MNHVGAKHSLTAGVSIPSKCICIPIYIFIFEHIEFFSM